MDNKIEYISLALMTIGAVAIGPIILVPLLISIHSKEKAYKLFVVLTTYMIASVVVASFNLIIFLTILVAFASLKTRSELILVPVIILSIASAFVTSGNIVLLSAFVVGISFLAFTQPSVMDYLRHGKKTQKIEMERDPVQEQLDALKEYYKQQMGGKR